ncbi:hypothetical protein [Longimicrobium sp.]|uniref:hypothetical protein n=1 Tax=Longimicrobium sp. TaxID=2029185 RepID=UPI003B3A4F75
MPALVRPVCFGVLLRPAVRLARRAMLRRPVPVPRGERVGGGEAVSAVSAERSEPPGQRSVAS